MFGHDELATLDATAQAELVRRGEVHPSELVEAAIERIERIDPTVGAVAVPLFERALQDVKAVDVSDAPFPGVPVVVKDSVPTAGDPWYRCSRLLREVDARGPFDSHVVARMRAAGMAVVGKAKMPEFEGGISTEPAAFGPARNPWEPGHTVGGSSGGSAAAVAAGLVPLALGVDGGGSIRIPSSICGVVGLKPSRGRTSLFPVFTEEGVSTAGPIARSVRDCAAALDAMAGRPHGDHFTAPTPVRPFADEVGVDPGRLRIGLWAARPGGIEAHADCVAAGRETAALLESLGHDVVESHPAELDEKFFHSPEFVTVAVWIIAYQIRRLEAELGRPIGPDDVEPTTWAAASVGFTFSATDLERGLRGTREMAVRFASWWDEGFDLLLTPTIAVPPFPLGAITPASPDEPWPDVAPWVPFTPHANLAGLPAVTLPLSWNADGLPIGSQLVAGFGREDVLVRVASQLEAARPWAGRRPPVHA